jgi:cytochrome c
MMKKSLLALSCCFVLAACGDDEKEAKAPTPPATQEKTMAEKVSSMAETASKEVAKASQMAADTVKETAEKADAAIQETVKKAEETVKEQAAVASSSMDAAKAKVEEVASAMMVGDAEKGEKVFKKCRACHDAKADGKHKIGPNLWGVVGRNAGSAEGFEKKYSDGIKAYGVVWTADLIEEYLINPTNFLKDKTGDQSAKSNMSYKLRKEKDRINVAAYLATLK